LCLFGQSKQETTQTLCLHKRMTAGPIVGAVWVQERGMCDLLEMTQHEIHAKSLI
jgi:hypothetical protein